MFQLLGLSVANIVPEIKHFPFLLFQTFGPWEIGIVLIIILIIFGVGKLPQVGGALGKGIKEFRKASTGVEEEINSVKKAAKGEKDADKSTEVEDKGEEKGKEKE